MKRLSIPYYLFQSSFQLLFWVPFFYQIQKTAGLSPKDIFFIQTIYYLSFAVFELPTGLISDKLGNKFALIISSCLMFVANLLPIFSYSPSVFLIHFLVVSLSRSFFSGASQAWLYNELKALHKSSEFKTIEGNARSFSLLSRTIAWSIGGYIIQVDSHLIYLATAISALTALGVSLSMKTRTRVDNKKRVSPLQILKSGLLKDARLRWSLIQGTGIFVMVRMIQVNLYQPVLLDKGFNVNMLGYIMAAMTITEALGSKLTTIYSRRYGLISATLRSILPLCGCMIILGLSGSYSTILTFIVFSFFIGISMPLARQTLNDSISTNEARATVLSFESLVNRLLSAAITLPMAYLFGSSVSYSYINIIAISSALLAYATYLNLKKDNRLVTTAAS